MNGLRLAVHCPTGMGAWGKWHLDPVLSLVYHTLGLMVRLNTHHGDHFDVSETVFSRWSKPIQWSVYSVEFKWVYLLIFQLSLRIISWEQPKSEAKTSDSPRLLLKGDILFRSEGSCRRWRMEKESSQLLGSGGRKDSGLPQRDPMVPILGVQPVTRW